MFRIQLVKFLLLKRLATHSCMLCKCRANKGMDVYTIC